MNKYYSGSKFCPKCRKIVPQDNLRYRCKFTKENEAEHRKALKEHLKKIGSTTQIADSGNLDFFFVAPKLPVFKYKWSKPICPVCKKLGVEVCSKMHEIKVEASRTEVISVVGFKGCGKSVYISSLIQCIDNYFGKKGIPCFVDGNNWKQKYDLEPGKNLPTGTPEKQTIDPIQIHIGNTVNGKYPLDLLIYDIAGEDLNPNTSPEVVKDYLSHLAMSSLLIYLFNPIHSQYLGEDWYEARKIEFENHSRRGGDWNPVRMNNDILTRIVSMIGDHYKNTEEFTKTTISKLPIYSAGCVVATDFLRWRKNKTTDEQPDDIKNKKLYEYYECYRPIDYIFPENMKKYINEKEGINEITEEYLDRETDKMSENVERQLIVWEEHRAVTKLKNNFKKAKFFGVSALGGSPTLKEGTEDDLVCPDTALKPRNIVNPIIWFLKEINILDKIK